MITAILIGRNKSGATVILGPDSVQLCKDELKRLKLEGSTVYDEAEVWTSSSGRVRRARLAKAKGKPRK